jgi:hypothetical protein
VRHFLDKQYFRPSIMGGDSGNGAGGAIADHEQPYRDHGHACHRAATDAQQRYTYRAQADHGGHGAPGAEPVDHQAGGGQGEDASHGQHQQHPTQLTGCELQVVPHLRDPGQPGGDDQTGQQEGHEDRGASA